jgi:hypothetical protein
MKFNELYKFLGRFLIRISNKIKGEVIRQFDVSQLGEVAGE